MEWRWPAGFLMLAAMQVFAQTPADYFPLHAGDQWIYEQSGAAPGEPVVVQVVASEMLDGKEYFLLAGLASPPAWVRMSPEGTLYRLDRGSGAESIYAVFSAGVGETYNSEVDACSPIAHVDSVSQHVEIPAGVFENVRAISYPPAFCADAGIQSEFYAPGIGLLQRTVTTIAGPRTMRLIYARVGDRTVVSRPEVSFGLSLDRAVYPRRPGASLTARIALRVQQPRPLEFTFPSGQRFELVLKDSQGTEVYRWSSGRAFILLFGTERFGPGERNWLAEVPLQTQDGRDLPPGKYTAECWLTAVEERRYAATVGFEIAAWQDPASGLAGNWIFEAPVPGGVLRAALALQVDGERLTASLSIDNHVLRGEGRTDGTGFAVLLTHADGSGPGHVEQLRLTGRLEDGRIAGTFDNGTDRGTWTGTRNQ